jgi:hypothetical protein
MDIESHMARPNRDAGRIGKDERFAIFFIDPLGSTGY